MRRIILILLLAGVGIGAYFALWQSPAGGRETDSALKTVAPVVAGVRAASFPQLKDLEITLHSMHSNYIYFESRFTFSSFFFARKLRYMILFNPEAIARNVPSEGLRAIVAHELAHVDFFNRQSRMGLASLIQLFWAPWAARFERSADLEAIALGYGPGLESYRTWLYRNVPASRMEEKKRDYFSPEEIETIRQATARNPKMMAVFTTCVPRDREEIEQESRNPDAPCAE